MSDGDESEESPGVLDPRTVRPTMHGRRDLEMDAAGWLIFIGMFILLIPLIPAIVLVVIVSKLLGLGRPRRLSWGQLTP